MKKQQLDKNGFLKSEKACFIANVFALVLNTLSLGGILAAIGIDKLNPEAAITTAAVSLSVGTVGVATTIVTDIAERRLEKKKGKTPSEQVLDMTYDIKKADEDGESKEFLEELGKLSQENGYEYSAE